MSKEEKRTLKKVFVFLEKAYRESHITETPLATDQTHFYTMVTSLLGSNVIADFDHDLLIESLIKIGNLIAGARPPKENQRLVKAFKTYKDVSSKQTTDVSRRHTRQTVFTDIVRLLCAEQSQAKSSAG